MWRRSDRGFGALLGLILVLSGAEACGVEYSENIQDLCLSRFSSDMDHLHQSVWCDWEHTLQPYLDLTNCTFVVALRSGCFWPNVEVDLFFVEVHRRWFWACAVTGRLLQDPPSNITSPFIVTPIIITLLMTGLVVWRSKRSEGIV